MIFYLFDLREDRGKMMILNKFDESAAFGDRPLMEFPLLLL
jgi:hypothetical protein